MSRSVLVIGLGQIGMGYDLRQSPEKHVLTHARAFSEHPSFRLVGGVDPDESRRLAFFQNYSCPAYMEIGPAVRELEPDLVVVATPTPSHEQVVMAVLDAGRPQAMLCEKPLSYEVDAARRMVDECRRRGTRLFVNYMRISDPGVSEIKERLDNGRVGKPVRAVVWYSKGLFNNGSHFLNLVQHWLGAPGQFQVISPGRLWGDSDPEPDFVIKFSCGEVFFIAAKEENFSHYTVELVCTNGRLRYEQGGERVIWQAAVADPVCEGYTVLSPREELIATELARGQWQVAEQLARCLEGHPARICTGEDALGTLEVLSSIRAGL